MKKTLITLLALAGLSMGATTGTLDETTILCQVVLTLNVETFQSIAGSYFESGEDTNLFTFTGKWEDGSDGYLGVASNGSNKSKSSFYTSWKFGTAAAKNTANGLPSDIFTSSTVWANIESITLTYRYDSTVEDNVELNGSKFNATRITTGVDIVYKDDSTPCTYSGSTDNVYFSESENNVVIDTTSLFLATGYEYDETYVSSVDITTLKTVPEPTTATLSLLALAGLAARRRRK